MAEAPTLILNTKDREIVITRELNAPRELVFDAWTDPKHIAEWWGPNGFTVTSFKMDARVGGVWQFVMHGPNGVDYDNTIVYSEIVRPERLVYKHGEGALKGDLAKPSPGEFVVTVTFEPLQADANKTLLTMHSLFYSASEREFVVKEHHAIEGGKQTIERLAKYIASVH